MAHTTLMTIHVIDACAMHLPVCIHAGLLQIIKLADDQIPMVALQVYNRTCRYEALCLSVCLSVSQLQLLSIRISYAYSWFCDLCMSSYFLKGIT